MSRFVIDFETTDDRVTTEDVLTEFVRTFGRTGYLNQATLDVFEVTNTDIEEALEADHAGAQFTTFARNPEDAEIYFDGEVASVAQPDDTEVPVDAYEQAADTDVDALIDEVAEDGGISAEEVEELKAAYDKIADEAMTGPIGETKQDEE